MNVFLPSKDMNRGLPIGAGRNGWAEMTSFLGRKAPIQTKKKLEFMFMKHYAPNRCEPSIEVIMKMEVVQWGVGNWGVRVDVNKRFNLL